MAFRGTVHKFLEAERVEMEEQERFYQELVDQPAGFVNRVAWEASR